MPPRYAGGASLKLLKLLKIDPELKILTISNGYANFLLTSYENHIVLALIVNKNGLSSAIPGRP